MQGKKGDEEPQRGHHEEQEGQEKGDEGHMPRVRDRNVQNHGQSVN